MLYWTKEPSAFATFIQYLPHAKRPKTPEPATVTDEAALIQHVHEIAASFMYTPHYAERRTVAYLGRSHAPTALGNVPLVADHLLVSNRVTGTAAHVVHMAFPGLRFALDSLTPESRSEVIRLLYDLQWLKNRRGEVPQHVEAVRRDPQGIISGDYDPEHRFFSLVLCNQDAEAVSEWSRYAPCLYGLMHLHSDGVDPAVAAAELEAARHQSTEFFVNFFQPHGLITVAKPWPILEPEDSTDGDVSQPAILEQRLLAHANRYEPYDLLPEYPPVRYLAYDVLELTSSIESVHRSVVDDLRRLDGQSSALLVARGPGRLRKLGRRRRLAASVDPLRLPSVRVFARRVMDAKQLSDTDEEYEDLQSTLLNRMLWLVTLLGVLLAALQIVLVFVR